MQFSHTTKYAYRTKIFPTSLIAPVSSSGQRELDSLLIMSSTWSCWSFVIRIFQGGSASGDLDDR